MWLQHFNTNISCFQQHTLVFVRRTAAHILPYFLLDKSICECLISIASSTVHLYHEFHKYDDRWENRLPGQYHDALLSHEKVFLCPSKCECMPICIINKMVWISMSVSAPLPLNNLLNETLNANNWNNN